MESLFSIVVFGPLLTCLLIAALRRRRVWLCPSVAAGLLYGCAYAETLEQQTLPATFLVLNGLTLLLGLVATVVWLVKASRPTPPLHRQFAELLHCHPEYSTRAELTAALDKITREVDRKLEESASRDERFDVKLDAISSKLSDGFSHVHRRIDPMAETLAATAKALDRHLDDHHRKEGSRNGN